MRIRSIVSLFKPNVASLGYALFLAINAAGVWGGVFPFLPESFQTHELLLAFFLAQSLVFMLSFLTSAVGVYYLPGPTRHFLVRLTSTPYALGWVCLIAAIYLPDFALALVVCGGGLLGLGSAGFYMLWQRLFASQNPESGNRDLAVGTAWAALMYFSLYLIPEAVTAFLIPLVFLPLFGLSITLRSRAINLDQPMFEDIPGEHPHVYRRIVRDYWRSALFVGIIGFCAGVMRALAVADLQAGSLVNLLSMGSMMIAAVALMVAWNLRSIRLNVGMIYRMAFPFVATAFLLLPLLPVAYGRWLAAILYAVYSVAIALMMIQCAQISRDRGVNPVFVYGFFGTIVYAFHDVGFIGGTLAENMAVIGLSPHAMVALIAVYLLALMYFVGAGGFEAALSSRTDGIELMALGSKPRKPRRVRGVRRASSQHAQAAFPPVAASSAETEAGEGGDGRSRAKAAPSMRTDAPDRPPFDRTAAQAQIVRETYQLTARETEIVELIARGNTVARIAEILVVSENTVRTHTKRIYTKLNIHKKQELVDLVESTDPVAL